MPTFNFKTFVVDDAGTELAYLDSGVPPGPNYTTIFVIHGIIFSSSIFQKVLDLAPTSGLRLVAINRRDYPGSTPLSPEKTSSITGSDEDKIAYLRDRGLEYLRFIDRFIQFNELPVISDDGKSGGVALLGWSLGSSFLTAAISNGSNLEEESRQRLSRYLRAAVFQDPPSLALGLPMAPGSWIPVFDESIPSKERVSFSIQWLSAYFDHGDISKRDISLLSMAAPTTAFVPTAFSLHPHLSDVVSPTGLAGSDSLLMASLGPQLHANFLKTCFNPETKVLFPRLKLWHIVGDMTGAYALFAHWQIQDSDEEHGGGHFNYEVVKQTNHFIHWDHPEKTIEVYKRIIAAA